MKLCVVIPVFNHEHAVGAVVSAVLTQHLPCILIDDASSPACGGVLDALVADHPNTVTLLRHKKNLGKGGAVMTGMRHAFDSGFTHALQIDADGQHDATDIPLFIAQALKYPDAVIAGCPIYDQSVPKGRLYARYLTHIWVWINTLSLAIRDSMCGFRIYPLSAVMDLARRSALGRRMDFDIEILVRLHWLGLRIVNLPTHVGYPSDGVSHFRAVWDNILISRLHTILFFGMLWRSPRLLARTVGARCIGKRS
jgi:glycosyltransferase involved in cell wall biosynthesis